MSRAVLTLLCLAAGLCAADFSGTWKLNTAKSKASGMNMPKEQIVSYTVKGEGYEYLAKGVGADGKPILASFTYVKDGVEIKTKGFPMWDALVMKGGNSVDSTAQLKRGGKVVGSVTRKLSKDGKSLSVAGKVELPDGKTGTYDYHYDKQ